MHWDEWTRMHGGGKNSIVDVNIDEFIRKDLKLWIFSALRRITFTFNFSDHIVFLKDM